MARPVIIGVNDKQVQRAIIRHRMTAADMLKIEFPIAAVIINKASRLVPVDTGKTKRSIGQHIQVATNKLVVDYVGPETPYSKYIEFGVPSKPNYPIQPFMRPASLGNISAITAAVVGSIKAFLGSKRGGA